MNVLLVEDNEDTASALAILFEMEGIDFRWARSGTETLLMFQHGRRATNAPVDVLMLDLQLPDMEGVQLVEQLAEVTALPPIVLYSAASHTELNRAAGAIGATAILRKPCDARCIMQTLSAAAPSPSDAQLA